MAPSCFLPVLAAALAAAPVQAWTGQVFNQCGSDWLLRLRPDTVAIPRGGSRA